MMTWSTCPGHLRRCASSCTRSTLGDYFFFEVSIHLMLSSVTDMQRIGSGKTAVVYRGRMHGKPVVVRMVTFKIRLSSAQIRQEVADVRRKHKMLYNKMPTRVPKLLKTILRPGSYVQIMEDVSGRPLGSYSRLSSKQCDDLRLLSELMWRFKISHGDLTPGNIIWSNGRWVLIDLDGLKKHATYETARSKDKTFLRISTNTLCGQDAVVPKRSSSYKKRVKRKYVNLTESLSRDSIWPSNRSRSGESLSANRRARPL